MKKVLIFLCFFFAMQLFAQQFEEVVHLKNGSIVRGTIIEQIPNVSIKIVTKDRSVFVYKMDEVLKITKEEITSNYTEPPNYSTPSTPYSSNSYFPRLTAKGFIGGVNLASVTDDNINGDVNSKLGFVIGGFLTYGFSEQFAIRPEIYYSSKGFSAETKEFESRDYYKYSMTTSYTMSLSYLEVPILGVLSLNRNFKLFAGPYLDIFLSGDVEGEVKGYYKTFDGYDWSTTNVNESDSKDIKSKYINSPGFGFTFGVEYVLEQQFSLGARYSLGLSNIGDDDDGEFKHRVIQFVVGYYLP